MTIERVYIPERPRPNRLGRFVFHDSRSRSYAYRGTGRLRTVIHERRVRPLDQGDLGMCTACAALGALATDPLYDAARRPPVDEAAARDLYAEATTVDEFSGTYPPDDTGSSGLAVAKVLKGRGLISGYSHAFTADDALHAVVDGPVITGVNWYSCFDTPDEAGYLRFDSGAELRGGHEVQVSGIDTARRAVWMWNSWGPAWGDSGGAWLPWDVWERLLREQGDVTVLRPATASPAPEPSDSDATFAKALRRDGWVDAPHVSGNARVARAARVWLGARGL